MPRLLIWLAALSLLGCSMTLKETDLLQPADRHATPPETPSRRNIEIVAPDATIRGWLWPAGDGRETVLMFIGNGGSAHDYVDAGAWLMTETRRNVALFDYRGYGMSGGVARLRDIVADGPRIFDALAERVAGPIHVVGFSLGAAVALHTAAERDVAGVVLLAPVSSVDDLATAIADGVSWPRSWFVSVEPEASLAALRPQPVDAIARVTAPILIGFGSDDPIAPAWMAERLLGANDRAVPCAVDGDHNALSPDHPGGRACLQRYFAVR